VERAVTGWLGRHLQALLFAVGRLARAPFATAFTLLVIAIALSLPASFALLVSSVRSVSGGFANAVDVTVYFQRETGLEKVQQLAANARARRGVGTVKVIPADQALEQFRKDSGFGEALAALSENPLPHAMDVRPAADATSPTDLENLKHYLSAWPEVELVQVDSDWVIRLNAILDLLRRIVLGTAVLLGAGVIAVIGNTIRLEILNRRAEIEITKLVGGSHAFVRRPFLYTGACYGALGAALASVLVLTGCYLLTGPVAVLAQSYGSDFRIATPTLGELGLLLAAGAGLGWLGAFVAATRHLARIEPRA
jgi:cell division transport system permease protein